MTRLLRSLIFVPGNNKRFLEKAKTLPADIVCFDLEDSVPDNEKTNARKLIKEMLKQRKDFSSEVFVRTNSSSSGKVTEDLEEILQKGLDGIVIPKVNNVKELKTIEKTISDLENKRNLSKTELIPSIESTQGVVNTYEIASSSNRISALVFGVFDLLNDNDGLVEDCKIGKSLGYAGKTLIHPDQIAVTHKIFHPNKIEIDWAKKVCDIYLKSTKTGKGATTIDGKMIDEVHYKQAKALLDLTEL
jgi:citrate lyase subunit beta/citryl-CoA lyase